MDIFVFYFFFYHECLVRILMRPSFAGSFSLIFHRFHLLNAKKKKLQGSFPFHSDDILDRLSLTSL